MTEFLKDDPSIIEKSSAAQLERVKKGDYVFIMDRTPLTVQVISDEAYNLVLLKEIFMPLPFGIGLQEGSPYQQIIYEGCYAGCSADIAYLVKIRRRLV